MKRTIFIRDKEWAYWAAKCKVMLPDKQPQWKWKIVGALLRTKVVKPDKDNGWVATKAAPEAYTFDANNAHFPGMDKFVFDRKKEAEGWLKLLCDHYYTEE